MSPTGTGLRNRQGGGADEKEVARHGFARSSVGTCIARARRSSSTTTIPRQPKLPGPYPSLPAAPSPGGSRQGGQRTHRGPRFARPVETESVELSWGCSATALATDDPSELPETNRGNSSQDCTGLAARFQRVLVRGEDRCRQTVVGSQGRRGRDRSPLIGTGHVYVDADIKSHRSNPPPSRSGPRDRGGRGGMRVMFWLRSCISRAGSSMSVGGSRRSAFRNPLR